MRRLAGQVSAEADAARGEAVRVAAVDPGWESTAAAKYRARLAVALDSDIVEGAVLAPVTAARVAEHAATATVGPNGLGVAAAHLTASAVLLRGAVTAHKTLDDALAKASTVGKTVGALPVLFFGGDMGGQWGEAVNEPWELATPGWWKDTGSAIADNAYEHPWVVDGGVDDLRLGLDALGIGMTTTAPGFSALFAGSSAAEGGTWPPITFEDSVRDLLGIGGFLGLFANGKPEVTPMDGDFAPIAGADRRPANVRNLFAEIVAMGKDQKAADGHAREAEIRIMRVQASDGVTRYVVEIPGTQNWMPDAGPNPIDLTNNLRLMAGTGSVQNDAIVQAMHKADIPRDAPVMLVGHSQGGITAASLACDPGVRQQFHITHVVTAGSPIARFDIPDDVHVLSLEHTRDAVPRLDAAENPDRPTWVTVHRDVDGLPTPDGSVHSVGASHPCTTYGSTAALVDSSTDPSVSALKSTIDPFLTSDPTRVSAREFRLTRTQ